MLVAAVLCLCAAAVTAGQGVWSLTRPPSADYVRQVLRAVAPTQLAAAVMLAAGAAVALSAAPPMSVVVLIVCVAGAVGTVAAGCWQSAKGVLRQEQQQSAQPAESCGGACATCTLSCG
jgi:membrane protein implicated in regulation of membrane protease activity